MKTYKQQLRTSRISSFRLSSSSPMSAEYSCCSCLSCCISMPSSCDCCGSLYAGTGAAGAGCATVTDGSTYCTVGGTDAGLLDCDTTGGDALTSLDLSSSTYTISSTGLLDTGRGTGTRTMRFVTVRPSLFPTLLMIRLLIFCTFALTSGDTDSLRNTRDGEAGRRCPPPSSITSTYSVSGPGFNGSSRTKDGCG